MVNIYLEKRKKKHERQGGKKNGRRKGVVLKKGQKEGALWDARTNIPIAVRVLAPPIN